MHLEGLKVGIRLESDLERLNMLQEIEKFHRSREPSWGKAKRKEKKRTLDWVQQEIQ